MKVVSNINFGSLIVDVYEDSSNDFYMTRKQINDALEYVDSKTIARIITRNKEIIGDGKTVNVKQKEGNRLVSREIEVFSFKQVFQILRFSRSPKANSFMNFTAVTMEQLLLNKADLKFNKAQDREEYIAEVESIIKETSLYGLNQSEIALILQQSKIDNTDSNLLILEALKEKQKLDTLKKRGRINQRVSYLAKEFLDNNYERAWSILGEEVKFQVGVNIPAIRNKAKEKREADKKHNKSPLTKVPTYLDIIEEYDAFRECENILKKICNEFLK